MFGLRPMWFHMTNIFLHAAACVLFTRVCTVVAGLRRNFAVIAGILFAVHPVHTEAVSLIFQLKNQLLRIPISTIVHTVYHLFTQLMLQWNRYEIWIGGQITKNCNQLCVHHA